MPGRTAGGATRAVHPGASKRQRPPLAAARAGRASPRGLRHRLGLGRGPRAPCTGAPRASRKAAGGPRHARSQLGARLQLQGALAVISVRREPPPQMKRHRRVSEPPGRSQWAAPPGIPQPRAPETWQLGCGRVRGLGGPQARASWVSCLRSLLASLAATAQPWGPRPAPLRRPPACRLWPSSPTWWLRVNWPQVTWPQAE